MFQLENLLIPSNINTREQKAAPFLLKKRKLILQLIDIRLEGSRPLRRGLSLDLSFPNQPCVPERSCLHIITGKKVRTIYYSRTNCQVSAAGECHTDSAWFIVISIIVGEDWSALKLNEEARMSDLLRPKWHCTACSCCNYTHTFISDCLKVNLQKLEP